MGQGRDRSGSVESHDCAAMESQVEVKERGGFQTASRHQLQTSWVGSHRGCESLVGSPCPNSRS